MAQKICANRSRTGFVKLRDLSQWWHTDPTRATLTSQAPMKLMKDVESSGDRVKGNRRLWTDNRRRMVLTSVWKTFAAFNEVGLGRKEESSAFAGHNEGSEGRILVGRKRSSRKRWPFKLYRSGDRRLPPRRFAQSVAPTLCPNPGFGCREVPKNVSSVRRVVSGVCAALFEGGKVTTGRGRAWNWPSSRVPSQRMTSWSSLLPIASSSSCSSPSPSSLFVIKVVHISSRPSSRVVAVPSLEAD